jgi:hypothetical protein
MSGDIIFIFVSFCSLLGLVVAAVLLIAYKDDSSTSAKEGQPR